MGQEGQTTLGHFGGSSGRATRRANGRATWKVADHGRGACKWKTEFWDLNGELRVPPAAEDIKLSAKQLSTISLPSRPKLVCTRPNISRHTTVRIVHKSLVPSFGGKTGGEGGGGGGHHLSD